MKRLEEYTQQELVDLKDDDLEKMFLIECASRGYVLPASLEKVPDAPETRAEFQKDVKAWRVKTGYSDYLWFKTELEADNVAKLLRDTTIHVSNGDYRTEKAYINNSDRDADYPVDSVEVYSYDLFNKLKDELALYESKKRTYDAILSRRNDAISKHNEVWKDIHDAINTARTEITRVAELQKALKQYQTIAGGDATIAKKFLVNAHYSELSDLNDDLLKKVGVTREEINNLSKTDEEIK
jgi:hypothetical protein